MQKPNDIRAVLEAIENGSRFLVAAHARPDGDAIGSMLACGMILQQLGKQVDIVSRDRVPVIYRHLPCVDTIRATDTIGGEYDAVILLECDGIARTGLRGLEGRFTINIDHHFSGKLFANINWIENDACAVAAMIYELAMLAGVRITPEMATCLYIAVLTDTGSFCYAGTDARAFDIAADLVRHGAHPATIAYNVYFSNPTSKMRLLGAALSSLQREGRLAWMSVTQHDMHRTAAAEEDCEGLVNYAIGIDGIDVAVLLRELADGRIRLSLRSKGEINVASIAERFGGGGHSHASGCTIDGPLPAATARIHDLLRECLRTQPAAGATRS
ncbi:MAG TPA: DHH family phosphoesterase [Acidobacteriaceae bacterium]|nr:DHH family phosphoesterase [Acidobacteriaceae bacterium]